HTAPPPTEPYTLSLHDALPISPGAAAGRHEHARAGQPGAAVGAQPPEGLVASDRTTEAGRGLVLRRGPLSAFQLTLAAPSARDAYSSNDGHALQVSPQTRAIGPLWDDTWTEPAASDHGRHCCCKRREHRCRCALGRC